MREGEILSTKKFSFEIRFWEGNFVGKDFFSSLTVKYGGIFDISDVIWNRFVLMENRKDSA